MRLNRTCLVGLQPVALLKMLASFPCNVTHVTHHAVRQLVRQGCAMAGPLRAVQFEISRGQDASAYSLKTLDARFENFPKG